VLVRPNRRTIAVAILALLSTLGIGAAVSAQAADTPQTWSVLVGSENPSMAVQGMRFLPGDITIDEGDTVTWKANSAEIHTVTFFPGGTPQDPLAEFNPGDMSQITQVGGTTYDGTSYYNSGLLTTVPTGGDAGPLPPVPHYATYSLTFPDAGTFTYYCLVHGKMMRGVVHVQDAGTPYPYTQAEITADAHWQARAINRDGAALRMQAREMSGQHRVLAGADDGYAMLMRFVAPRVVIHRGQKVHFLNTMSMGAPHTVTFGAEPQGPAVLQASGNAAKYRGGDLNSGLMPPGAKFTVTFLKAGTYHYICALHDFMGMTGTVVVRK
jgi:plastocyanin